MALSHECLCSVLHYSVGLVVVLSYWYIAYLWCSYYKSCGKHMGLPEQYGTNLGRLSV